jgi:cupin 2 domain-containing protein
MGVSEIDIKNIFDRVQTGAEPGNESTDEILARRGLKIERIVSHNYASPPGFWYEQALDEWVMVLSGSAGLRFEDEGEARQLKAGDYLLIPATKRHRVDWTSEAEPTIWLALHFGAETG